MLSALINSNKDTMIELTDALESFAFPKDEEFDEEATLTLIAKLSDDAILQYNIWKNSDNHLLFNAIVKFLQKLQYEKGLQVGRLLRILPAHAGQCKSSSANTMKVL